MAPVGPVVPVDLVDLRIVQLVPAVRVDPAVPVGPVTQVVPVDQVAPVDPVAVALVRALARADQRPERLDGREANLHGAVNLKGPSVKSLTTWKRHRWVVYVCLEEMAIASDFHVEPA